MTTNRLISAALLFMKQSRCAHLYGTSASFIQTFPSICQLSVSQMVFPVDFTSILSSLVSGVYTAFSVCVCVCVRITVVLMEGPGVVCVCVCVCAGCRKDSSFLSHICAASSSNILISPLTPLPLLQQHTGSGRFLFSLCLHPHCC